MANFEVEIKSLLGSPERAEALRARMHQLDPGCTHTSTNKQLNHYFVGGTLEALVEEVATLLSDDARAQLEDIAGSAKEFSVRTREKDGIVLLVVKASVDDTTSANGISRREFEEEVPASLDELDRRVLAAGFEYQAKWSREREEYTYKDANVCLDKNAGYGYLAEFEKVIDDRSAVETTRDSLRALMQELEVEELAQERLARMFDHYNANWSDYYGTDKIFIIE